MACCSFIAIACSFVVVTTATPLPYTVNPLRGRNVIVDADGREVVFRGVNVGVEIWKNDQRPWEPAVYANGKCPSAEGSVNQPPVCGVQAGSGKWGQSISFDSKNDLAQMRALGFNLIRLAISWSLLEPIPLQYSTNYLERIGQVVDWAAEQDIMVVIDMHQDEFGPSIGDDGAASWACLNVTIPWWAELVWRKVAKLNVIPYSKQVLLAFDALYTNQIVAASGKGLQEHFFLAWEQIVRRFDTVPNVIGYEIINEPPPGILTTLQSAGDVPVIGFSTKYLFPMYRRYIQAMTGVRDGMRDCTAAQPIGDDCAFPDLGIHSKKLVLFEPMALRNQVDFSLQVSKPFTEYRNIVFAPHVYTYFFTAKDWPPSYHLALDSAWFEANMLKAGVLVTEFGGSASSASKVGNITQQLDLHRGTSGTLWTWKENGNWGMFESRPTPSEPNGPLRQVRVLINSRIYARVVAGGILEHSFDHFTGSFRLQAIVEGNWVNGPTEVYIPPQHNNSKPSVSGSAMLKDVNTQPDGSLVVQVMPSATGGAYQVSVGDSMPVTPTHDKYNGISLNVMSRVAQALWPLHNSSSDEHLFTDDNGDLSLALADVAKEIYATSQLYV